MKVARVEKPGTLVLAEVPFPSQPDPDEIIVKMKAVGICGSDVHVYHGRSAFAAYPRILGHELAGEVYQTGEKVEHLKVGDRVVIDPVNACGECYACRNGRPNICKNIKVLAAHIDGGFQEYFKVKAQNAYKVPDGISWEYAATAEPYTIAAEAIERGAIRDGDTVLICGAGPIGMVVLQAAKRFHVRIAMLDLVDSRLEIAKSMGAELTINPRTCDPNQAILDFTDGEGVNLIFEATGNIPLIEDCVSKYASQGARLVVLGFPPEPAKIAPLDIMKRELEIHGSRLSRRRFPEVLEWLKNGEVDPSRIITHTFPFAEIQRAMDLIDQKPSEVCKVLLTF